MNIVMELDVIGGSLVEGVIEHLMAELSWQVFECWHDEGML